MGAPADYPDSWYAATARQCIEAPPLSRAEKADFCVIGAGYTGLSAALHLRERGYDVVLLDARRAGWGASGRNGGQIGSGQRQYEFDLEAQFGAAAARALWDLAEDAKQTVRELVEVHGIDCDLTPGQLITASKPAHCDELRRRVEKLRIDYGYDQVRYVERDELGTMLGSSAYFGATLDEGGAHLHPLNYALGLAAACHDAGVRVYEHSPVTGVSGKEPLTVRTPNGWVQASNVVYACNGYLGGLERRLARRIMPINNFIIATAVLGESAVRELIRDNVCVHDTRFVVNYFRRTPDHRLLFGGGENYRRRFPTDIRRFVRPHMLKVFPQLNDVTVDYAWGGTLAITINRLPDIGRLNSGIFYAQGFSGHGISIGTLAGKLIAEAAAGTVERFDVMARLPTREFPGGTMLRWPGQVLGMLYYSLRDRL